MVNKFSDEGLTLEAYLKAVLKQPQLFSMSPDTIEKNITGVVNKFSDEGLTLEAYLKAVLKTPSLFCMSPDAIKSNITDLVNKFSDAGLTLADYLTAALKQPQLFCQSPNKIETNIISVVNKFSDAGLTLEAYLKAALKQPQLFCQSPDTIIGHINMMIAMYKNGKLIIKDNPYDKDSQTPLKPLFDFLVGRPINLALDDNNLILREFSKSITGLGLKSNFLNNHPRKKVEKELAAALGHSDLSKSVPKNEHTIKDITKISPELAKSFAERMLLRALIHEGVIKGGTVER